jgi:hypothetical protein
MLTYIYLGLHRRLKDGVIITNPSVVTEKVQPLSVITKATYNKKGVLIQNAVYPILRQTALERSRSNYHMASLEGLKCADLFLVEKADIDNWVGDIEETKTSRLNKEIRLVVDGQIITGTLIEFHNQASVEGMLTNLLKGKYRAVLKTQQANSSYEFDEMMQELYCAQTQGSTWGWLNIIRSLDTENMTNAQQMEYIKMAFEDKLQNRMDRRYYKHYFAEQSISDTENATSSNDDDSTTSLLELVSESWHGDSSYDGQFDDELEALKAKLPEHEKRALENYLSYVPDDKLFGEDVETGAPICIKRKDVAGWNLPVNFINIQLGDTVQFQYQDGSTVIVTVSRLAFDTTRTLFKIAGLDDATSLAAFGLDKEYLKDVAKTIKPAEEKYAGLSDSTVPSGSKGSYTVATYAQPPLTKFEVDILNLAKSDDFTFLEQVSRLANKRYASHVTIQYDAGSDNYVMQHNNKRTVRFDAHKPEALLRAALGK